MVEDLGDDIDVKKKATYDVCEAGTHRGISHLNYD